MAVINQNEQLRGRFIAPIYIPRFTWDSEENREEFMACLEAFQKALDRFDFPELGSDEMAFRFYCATGGLIGYVAKILHEACLNAQLSFKQGEKLTISLSDLAEAYNQALWKDCEVSKINPFDTEFDATPSDYLIKLAKQIGVASPEPAKSRTLRAKISYPSSAEALSA
jgi:hypothetical protein